MPNNNSGDPKAKRFRIAFSFAGEKRDFVAKVARILADRFGEDRILYDKFHETEFARRDLGTYLPELYHKESDLVVVVACLDYENKEWLRKWFRLKLAHEQERGHPCLHEREARTLSVSWSARRPLVINERPSRPEFRNVALIN